MAAQREPIFNFSEPLPVYWAGVLVAIHLLNWAFTAALGTVFFLYGMLTPFGIKPLTADLISLYGHGFTHGSWSHLLMNSLMGIVFGIVTIRGAKVLATSKGKASTGQLAFIAILFGGILLGGLTQWAVWAGFGTQQAAMVGASGGVSALFAAAGWAMGGREKMLQFGFGWAAINVALVVAEPIFGVGISWAGHLGGYVAGMILAPFFVRASSTGFTVLR